MTMKLSDIDGMVKVASEYRKFDKMEKFLRANMIERIELKAVARGSGNKAEELSHGERGVINMQDFKSHLLETIKKCHDELRTKLSMYGVDKFDE